MTTQPTSEQFDIGEIATVVAVKYHPENVGHEVEIVDGLAWRQARNDRKVYLCYRVRHQDGRVFLCEPHELRKKRPPREDLQVVRWSECPWRPENTNV